MSSNQVSLKQKIIDDLHKAIKDGEGRIKISSLRVIVGELQRMPNKNLSDEEVLKVLKRLAALEKENLDRDSLKESCYLNTVKYYIPEQIADEEIEKWIKDNIDFSMFKNKFQVIKIVLNHFKESTDGKVVRNIIEKL